MSGMLSADPHTPFHQSQRINSLIIQQLFQNMIYQFQPILKQTLWGGDKIAALKHLSDAPTHVGESWELSGIEGHVSVVAHGPEAGLTLPHLIAKHGADLLGRRNFERFGTEFPLLIKIIDARQDLSVQVHPNDEIARRHGHPRGKTEMWYLLPSDPDASLLVGLRHDLSPEQFAAMVADSTICDALTHYRVSAGDCFFLPAGRIHSIGAGSMLVEIQQTSDVTYRIYDFDRTDHHGNRRPLHTALAAEAIDFHAHPDYQTHYTPTDDSRTLLVDCPHFTTSLWTVRHQCLVDYSPLDSFVVLICTAGHGTLIDNHHAEHPLSMGDTLLLPVTTTQIELRGQLQVIETYVGEDQAQDTKTAANITHENN